MYEAPLHLFPRADLNAGAPITGFLKRTVSGSVNFTEYITSGGGTCAVGGSVTCESCLAADARRTSAGKRQRQFRRCLGRFEADDANPEHGFGGAHAIILAQSLAEPLGQANRELNG
jgi:hypothetical protein